MMVFRSYRYILSSVKNLGAFSGFCRNALVRTFQIFMCASKFLVSVIPEALKLCITFITSFNTTKAISDSSNVQHFGLSTFQYILRKWSEFFYIIFLPAVENSFVLASFPYKFLLHFQQLNCSNFSRKSQQIYYITI
jgi:hypothetical protein